MRQLKRLKEHEHPAFVEVIDAVMKASNNPDFLIPRLERLVMNLRIEKHDLAAAIDLSKEEDSKFIDDYGRQVCYNGMVSKQD